MRCAHCKAETTPKTAYAEVAGWAKPRRSGGVNALLSRRNTGRVLCHACGGRLAQGLLDASTIGSEESRQETML